MLNLALLILIVIVYKKLERNRQLIDNIKSDIRKINKNSDEDVMEDLRKVMNKHTGGDDE